jgi:hypothetical protein
MKDLISAAIVIASLFAGTRYAEQIHNAMRKAAFEKVSHGLVRLGDLNRQLIKPTK